MAKKKKKDFVLTSHIWLCQCAAISIPAIFVLAYSGHTVLLDERLLLVGKSVSNALDRIL